MPEYMTAIERRNGDEVENSEHDIDHHHRKYKLAQRNEKGIGFSKARTLQCAKDDFLSGGRSILYKNKNQYGGSGNHKITNRSDYGSENVVEHGVLEVARVHRCGLGPAENRQVSEHCHGRQQQ